MKHRHNGKYLSKTKTGKIVAKNKPVHEVKFTYSKVPKDILAKNKGKTWNQIHKKYPHLSPLADTDGDKKRNYDDCRPFSKSQQELDDEWPEDPDWKDMD